MSDDIRFELRSDILRMQPDWCATKWVFETTPFLFDNLEPAELWEWKNLLAQRLDVDSKNVLITGSAAVGVSLNPSKRMKDFDSRSDVDVAVISTYHFDLAWRALRNLGTNRFKLGTGQRSAVDAHVKNYIYWGTIATDKILPILPFATEWIGALSHIGTVPPTEGRDVKVRIYRDFASLRAYLSLTFKNLRDSILESATLEPEPVNEEIP